jgi:hypothetical protein
MIYSLTSIHRTICLFSVHERFTFIIETSDLHFRKKNSSRWGLTFCCVVHRHVVCRLHRRNKNPYRPRREDRRFVVKRHQNNDDVKSCDEWTTSWTTSQNKTVSSLKCCHVSAIHLSEAETDR